VLSFMPNPPTLSHDTTLGEGLVEVLGLLEPVLKDSSAWNVRIKAATALVEITGKWSAFPGSAVRGSSEQDASLVQIAKGILGVLTEGMGDKRVS
jgi:hypothetical protein